MSKKEIFIEKAIKKHGNIYDYSKVEYIDSLTKVCIVCPEHGEFWQTPSAHVRGNGCPICANKKRGCAKTTKDAFLKKAMEIHGDKYDYSRVDFINLDEKVCIICPEHGEFWQTPSAHIYLKQGCPKCAGRGLTQEEIIEKFKLKHGARYDYSKVIFTKMHEKVCIICPEHGEFWQTPSKHLLGQGCPKCSKEEMGRIQRITLEEYIDRVNKIHGHAYDYSQVNLTTLHNKIKIICPKHGEFWQLPYDHLNGHACPKCGLNISHAEDEIYDFLVENLGSDMIIRHERNILGDGKEIDLYIPSLKIGIEYNGLKWHSEEYGKGKRYHIGKTEKAEEKGVQLIQIFEDEYVKNKELVFKKLSHILHLNKKMPRIMARKCRIMEIDHSLAASFLKDNHIQGKANTTIAIGAVYLDRLVGVMCFVKRGNNEWELNRCATDNNYICQGVSGKLFKYFIKKYDPQIIKSFADRRWTIDSPNNLYEKLGFVLKETLKPDYRYINPQKPTERIHKFNLRKKSLHRHFNLDMNLTEREMIKKIGYYRIWDCGLYKYVWEKKGGQ